MSFKNIFGIIFILLHSNVVFSITLNGLLGQFGSNPYNQYLYGAGRMNYMGGQFGQNPQLNLLRSIMNPTPNFRTLPLSYQFQTDDSTQQNKNMESSYLNSLFSQPQNKMNLNDQMSSQQESKFSPKSMLNSYQNPNSFNVDSTQIASSIMNNPFVSSRKFKLDQSPEEEDEFDGNYRDQEFRDNSRSTNLKMNKLSNDQVQNFLNEVDPDVLFDAFGVNLKHKSNNMAKNSNILHHFPWNLVIDTELIEKLMDETLKKKLNKMDTSEKKTLEKTIEEETNPSQRQNINYDQDMLRESNRARHDLDFFDDDERMRFNFE